MLGFTAREAADVLETSVASVNSALQRARATLDRELPSLSQQETLRALGDERASELVSAFVDAWNRADVDGIVAMLTEEASFSMPPLPAWFRGRADIATFIAERVFATPWQFSELRVSGQPAMIGYRRDPDSGRYELGALNVFTLEGDRIAALTAFLHPELHVRLGLPREVPAPDR